MHTIDHPALTGSSLTGPPSPLLICLLGNFRLLHTGHPVAIPYGGKIEILLGRLGIQPDHRVPRPVLVDLLWPTSDSALGTQ